MRDDMEGGPRGRRGGHRGRGEHFGPSGFGGPGFDPEAVGAAFAAGFGPGGRGGRGGRGGPGGRGGRGMGRPGGWQQADLPPADDAAAWFAGRLPDGWFTGTPTVTVDREEIVVVGELPAPDVAAGVATDAESESASDAADAAEGETGASGGSGAAGGAQAAAAAGRIRRFREQTREERVRIAAEAEARYGRKVAWGATIGEQRELFTHLAVPVMTRLRQPERRVLDTLVDAGVARSRSDALAWCVNLVSEHSTEWLSGLRDAMAEVDKLRRQGPTA